MSHEEEEEKLIKMKKEMESTEIKLLSANLKISYIHPFQLGNGL